MALEHGDGLAVRRVLHVEDCARTRSWLEVAVRSAPDLTVVGAAEDGRDGVEMAAALSPDVIVLDQQMPGLSGLDALPLLRQACPGARVVMWCNNPLVREVALERGAADFVDKAEPLDHLVTALRS